MALQDYSTELFVVTVNGREIEEWGETDPPLSDDPIDQKSTLRRGLGGGAAKLGRINPGRKVTFNMQPGGKDTAYLQGLFNSHATITFSAQQIGTLETAVGAEGVIVNDGTNGRGGASITDDQYIAEFNVWTGLKGGA